MGEVLSQSEIDNLLKALNSGELDIDEAKNTEEKQVKNYDFARPIGKFVYLGFNVLSLSLSSRKV